MAEAPTTCECSKHGDGSRTWERDCPTHGEAAMRARLLPVGAPIQHACHPELTGRILCHEFSAPGVLSAIPYSIDWDEDSRAADVLGWFYGYAGIDSVEAAEARS